MPTIKVTAKGTTTNLYKHEVKKFRDVSRILELLAWHQPAVKEYETAWDAVSAVIALWDYEEEERGERGMDAPNGEPGESVGRATVETLTDNPAGLNRSGD